MTKPSFAELDKVVECRDFVLYVTKELTAQSGRFFTERITHGPGIMVLGYSGHLGQVATVKDGFLHMEVSDKPIRDWVVDTCRGLKLKDSRTHKRIR